MSDHSSSVALVKCSTYDQAQVDSSVARALDLLGGIARFVKPKDRVLLKINLLVGAAPEKAVTTHPAVVRALIRQVRAVGAVPAVGDCSGGEGPPSETRFRNACKASGFAQVCDEEGVELAHLSAESLEVENPQGKAFRHFTLARAVVEADVVISLPKLKTHGLCLFTGGVKNNFGCLPGMTKMQMHARARGVEDFSQLVVDLMLAVRPALTVMDAVVGMDGDGPRNGDPKEIGALLASVDPVALDAVACEMVGIEPMMVPTTRLANEQGAGAGDLDCIEVLGDSIASRAVDDFRLPSGPEGFFHAKGVWRFLQARLVAKPTVAAERCRACWTCIEHCPVEALFKNGQVPVFDYEKCIRCYCCQELCPHDAIKLKQPVLARFVR